MGIEPTTYQSQVQRLIATPLCTGSLLNRILESTECYSSNDIFRIQTVESYRYWSDQLSCQPHASILHATVFFVSLEYCVTNQPMLFTRKLQYNRQRRCEYICTGTRSYHWQLSSSWQSAHAQSSLRMCRSSAAGQLLMIMTSASSCQHIPYLWVGFGYADCYNWSLYIEYTAGRG